MGDSPLIVVVDDSDEICELFDHVLSSVGYRVLTCRDAPSAFEAIQRERPALVITDISLGVTNGLDLITRIRSDLARPPPIIACSGFSHFEREAIDRGAYSFVPKPFGAESLLATIAHALGGQPPSPPVAERARAHADALRREAVVAAQEALARLGDRRPELERRCGWTTRWLPRYFGFGSMIAALIDREQLRVFAQFRSRFAVGDTLDQSAKLIRDVVETGSNLVVPDAERWAARPVGRARFFAGVPVTDGSVAIGALAFFDDEPRHFDSEDLALIEAIGRIDSATLSARDASVAMFWTSLPLISQAGMRLLIDLELKRSERTSAPLFLLAFQADDAAWFAEVDAGLQAPRSAIAALGGQRYALLLARPSTGAALHDLGAALHSVRQHGGFRGAGMVALDGGNVAMRSSGDVLSLAGELCIRAARRGSGEIEAVTVRHEAWQPEATPFP